MTRIAIQSSLLDWARQRSGLTVESLVESFPKYEEWMSGDIRPTLGQLEKFAAKTRTPLGFLFLKHPPADSLPVPDFRTMGNQTVKAPSPDLIETIQTMQRRQGWMRDYLVECGREPLEFIGSAEVTSPIGETADSIRKVLSIDEEWAKEFPNWEEALKSFRLAVIDAGILVFANGIVGTNTRRALDPNEFRGFVLCDDIAPLIFLNNADAKSARMFTLAHELVHVWLGKGGVFNLENLQPSDSKIEQFCNAVAAEFLVPQTALQRNWDEFSAKSEPFAAAAKHFKVSPIVAARRALDLKKITKRQFLEFYRALLAKHREKKGSGGNYYTTQGTRLDPVFAEAVHRTVSAGKMAYTEAYRLTGMKGETFERFFTPDK